MSRYRAFSRYDDKSETGMLVLFLVGSLIIFFLVIGVQGYQPTQCGPLSIREGAAPLDLDPSHQEIPAVPVPGPTVKPEFQIKIF